MSLPVTNMIGKDIDVNHKAIEEKLQKPNHSLLLIKDIYGYIFFVFVFYFQSYF